MAIDHQVNGHQLMHITLVILQISNVGRLLTKQIIY